MNCPPFKRLRGLNQEPVTTGAFDDPFGDDGGFTQDDLDEIDIIASQAITESAVGTGKGSEPAGTKATEQHRPLFTGQNQTVSRGKSFGINHSSSSRGNAGMSSREPLCNGQQLGSDSRDSYTVLEAQHTELKRKLKEVEDEILLKSGEIRVLRDSLKAAQQDKEAQRQNQILLDTQRKAEQSEREKELNKKVQSLQSELQFKEAEINDIKTKLHSSDKNKTNSPLPKNSPKTVGPVTQRHHGNSSSSSSPLGNGFITKEMFEAQVSSRTTPVKNRKEDHGPSSSRTRALKDPFQSVKPAPKQPRGGVLLGLLLQQPLTGSSLGLTHLLSMNLNVVQQMSSQLSGRPKPGSDAVPAALSPVQSLAVTGINMLSVSQSGARNNSSSSSTRSCPGAVLLLPLMDFHLTRLRQAVDVMKSNATSSRSGGSSSSSASSSCSAALGSLEEEESGLSGFSMEDTGLAALRLLDLLLTHSDEVVEAVLLNTSEREDANSRTSHAETLVGSCHQNSVLKSLLRLSESRLGGNNNSQSNDISSHAMKTLRLLADRTPPAHADRLQGVLQVVLACVSSDSRLQVVSDCVSLLVSLSNHQTLSNQLCSQHEPCVFLKFLQFIRTRADSHAAHTDWILLDLQVVRLLSRLTTQRPERSSCQCYTELVQTVLIVFHRQWLYLRGSPELTEPTECDSTMSSSPWWSRPSASLLRETLLLLHWLLQHHGSFSESCRPLLHMYDQVIPAVRDTLRKIPELTESEELALEEICRSESDEAEEMETETGS